MKTIHYSLIFSTLFLSLCYSFCGCDSNNIGPKCKNIYDDANKVYDQNGNYVPDSVEVVVIIDTDKKLVRFKSYWFNFRSDVEVLPITDDSASDIGGFELIIDENSVEKKKYKKVLRIIELGQTFLGRIECRSNDKNIVDEPDHHKYTHDIPDPRQQ